MKITDGAVVLAAAGSQAVEVPLKRPTLSGRHADEDLDLGNQ